MTDRQRNKLSHRPMTAEDLQEWIGRIQDLCKEFNKHINEMIRLEIDIVLPSPANMRDVEKHLKSLNLYLNNYNDKVSKGLISNIYQGKIKSDK